MTNCSVAPSETASDAGIAGAGVLLSFIITAGLALVLSASLILQDTLGTRGGGSTGTAAGAAPASAATIARKLLNSYSDQQIVTGIGLQSLGLAQAGRLVPYHFFLIWMLGLLSTAVHNSALLALVHDFRRDWALRWLRQALMLANLGLSCVYGVYILRGLARSLPPTLPMACVWDTSAARSTTKSAAGGFQYVATVAAVAGNCVVFALATWYLHSRRQRWFRAVQLAGVALMAAVAVGATVRVVLLSQAFGHPSVTLSDRGETQWSFGQLLSLLLLLLPVVSLIEIARGEIQVAAPVDDGDDTAPLVGSAWRSSFQPNPFFGRRRSKE